MIAINCNYIGEAGGEESGRFFTPYKIINVTICAGVNGVAPDRTPVDRIDSGHEALPALTIGSVAEKRLLDMVAVGQFIDHYTGFFICESLLEHRAESISGDGGQSHCVGRRFLKCAVCGVVILRKIGTKSVGVKKYRK